MTRLASIDMQTEMTVNMGVNPRANMRVKTGGNTNIKKRVRLRCDNCNRTLY